MRASIICERCPVTKQCLDYALDRHSLNGIWAGTSERGGWRIRTARINEQEAVEFTLARRRAPSGNSRSSSSGSRAASGENRKPSANAALN
jgi:hypothetical protein